MYKSKSVYESSLHEKPSLPTTDRFDILFQKWETNNSSETADLQNYGYREAAISNSGLAVPLTRNSPAAKYNVWI